MLFSSQKKNFDQEIMNSNHVWIVEFFAPWCGHCKQLAPIWEQAAKKLKGIVKVAAVDADVEKELGGRFGIKGFPSIKVFNSPVGASKPQKTKSGNDYNGGRTLKDITTYAAGLLPSKQITKITTRETFDTFAQNELPRVILFSEKATSPPLFTALSLEFHGKVAFGFGKKGGVAEDVLAEVGVTSFPSIVLIPSKESKDAIKFDGEMKTEELIKFVTQHTGIAGESAGEKKTEKKPEKKPEKAEEVPVDIYEINSEKDLDTHCVEKKHLCILAFLDPLSDSSSHENYLKTLLEIAQKFSQQFSVVWIDIAKQPEFSSHFNCLEIPTLRVWNKSKNVAVSVVASITTKSVSEFLSGVVSGKVKTTPIAPAPAIVEGGVKLEVIEESPLGEEQIEVKRSHISDEL